MNSFNYFPNVKIPKAVADPLIGFFMCGKIAPGVQSSNTCSVSFGALTARHFLFVKNPKGATMYHKIFLFVLPVIWFISFLLGLYLLAQGKIILGFIITALAQIPAGMLIGYRLRCERTDKTIRNQMKKISEQSEKISELKSMVL